MRSPLLKNMMTPGLNAGYITDTLLDPHAANNNLPGQQFSISRGCSRWPSRSSRIIRGRPKTHRAYVPAMVDQAQVFFEHTPAKRSDLTTSGARCLSRAMGRLSITTICRPWNDPFRQDGCSTLVPKLHRSHAGLQAPLVQELQLNGQIDKADTTATSVITADTRLAESARLIKPRVTRVYGPAPGGTEQSAELSGTAAPGLGCETLARPCGKRRPQIAL